MIITGMILTCTAMELNIIEVHLLIERAVLRNVLCLISQQSRSIEAKIISSQTGLSIYLSDSTRNRCHLCIAYALGCYCSFKHYSRLGAVLIHAQPFLALTPGHSAL